MKSKFTATATRQTTAIFSAEGGTVNVVGSENQVNISPPVGNLFYQLKK